MISACGVICSECPAYQAASKGVAHRQRTAKAWRRIYGLREMPQNMPCGGCLGPDDQLFHSSRSCKARLCCRGKGYGTCAECPEESCTDLEKAQCVWDSVPQLAATLSPEDFATYARPYCGHRERLASARASRAANARRRRK